MIKVTRFDGSEFWVNAEMIKFVEATPDTVISLLNSEKIVVKEPLTIVVDAILDYRKQLFSQIPQLIEQPERKE